MTDRPRVASNALPAQAEHGSTATGHRYLTFSVLVLLTGILAAVGMILLIPGHVEADLLWVGPVLAAGFLLAEQLTIDTNVRRIDWTISFTEIPLVIGLLVAPFWVVLVAHLIAGLLTQLRRRATAHVVYNSGAMCLEIVLPFAIYQLLLQAGASAPHWVLALVAVLSSPLVSTALALVALRIIGTGLRAAEAARLSARTLVVGLLNASVGLIGYRTAVLAPWGGLLVAALAVALVALYVAYSGLLREQRDLETLSEFSLTVARTGQEEVRPRIEGAADEPWHSSAHWKAVAERIRDQLGAHRVVLRLWDDPTVSTTTLVAGSPLPEGALAASATELLDDPMLRPTSGQVRCYRLTGALSGIARSMRRRGAHEALVVPLSGTSQLLGTLEAHDRASRWRGFSRADVRLMRTVASHLTTTIDNRRLLARLRHGAYHDPLTGLLNRLGFTEIATAPLREYPSSVVLRVDLDVMSTVSDALGYAWGDRMVVAAGARLRELLGDGVPVARLEGGNFAALLVDHTSGQAHGVAERVLACLCAPYPVDRLTVEANAVLGYASATTDPNGAPDVDTLLQRADVAVRAGRSSSAQIRGYSPSMGQLFLRRFQLVTQFRHALETGQVHVHYQPKISLSDRHVVGVEALVRWSHPEYGNLDPDEFVPAVEATGLIDALTSFVTDQALARVRHWLDHGVRMSASVNLSVRNLANAEFPDRVAEAINRHDVPARLLTFELTESQVMSDPERAMPVLRRLHELGVVIAVDDFGTGYSSLAYLRQLPVDEVKIDKSFVLGMGSDLGDLAVVRSIVELGHSLGLNVVAEGVEEEAAREALFTMGCDIAQGYLISRPLSEERLEGWLRARTSRASGSGGLDEETVFTLVR